MQLPSARAFTLDETLALTVALPRQQVYQQLPGEFYTRNGSGGKKKRRPMTLLPAQHWAYSFSIGAEDIESITNLLLEKEMPLSSVELATAIIQQREANIKGQLERQFQGAKVYQPCGSFAIGDRLTFSQMNYRTAKVVGLRDGFNNDVGAFKVLSVCFEKSDLPSDLPSDGQTDAPLREFAAEYHGPHPLNEPDKNHHPGQSHSEFSPQDIVNAPGVTIIGQVNDALEKNPDLVRIAGTWFVRELLLDINIGHLHLAEAILDMRGGGPLATAAILDEIGGLGDMPKALQVFTLNYAMNQDERFQEVGPAGVILWHLTRMLPRMVRQVPPIMQYLPVEYDRSLLNQEMRQLEYDLDDEHSLLKSKPPDDEVSITLTYPHRRIGSLPINSETRHILPDAKTPRIAITIVDDKDKEEYTCWVVHNYKYVYGLAELYKKYHLPVGAYAYLHGADDRGRYKIEFDIYERPEKVSIPVVKSTENSQLRFVMNNRAVGADFDEMIIIGMNAMREADALGKEIQDKQVPLAKLLRNLLAELSKQNPQNTVHATVLYSAINILRRCPPGPIFATLVANREFVYVGGNYWKLRE